MLWLLFAANAAVSACCLVQLAQAVRNPCIAMILRNNSSLCVAQLVMNADLSNATNVDSLKKMTCILNNEFPLLTIPKRATTNIWFEEFLFFKIQKVTNFASKWVYISMISIIGLVLVWSKKHKVYSEVAWIYIKSFRLKGRSNGSEVLRFYHIVFFRKTE